MNGMTPQEFKERMAEICAAGDEEVRHAQADDLLCELLDQLGYGEGVKIFRHTSKWYA